MKNFIAWLALGVSVSVFIFTWHVDQREQHRRAIEMTPRLTATASIGKVFVGRHESRIDNLVSVPRVVFRHNDAPVSDVTLDLLFDDGTGRREVSLNDYLREQNLKIMHRNIMGDQFVWSLGHAYISAEQRDRYASGEIRCRVKLQLSWKDWAMREHRFVELAELVRSDISPEGFGGGFWFKAVDSFSSLDQPEKVEEHWGLPFKEW